MQRIYRILETHAQKFSVLVWVIAALGIAAALFHLFALAVLQGIEDPVAPIHWEMGRAILNGLVLYEDIFETKPPGIFVVSALSHALFGNGLLGNILHTTFLFLLPAIFVLVAWRSTRDASKKHRSLIVAFALLGSVALVRYLLPHPGPWSPDFFGAAFGILYLLAIAQPDTLTKGRMVLAGVMLFGAIGIKEPFFLSTLAGAMILLRTKKDFLKGWVIPLLGAAGAGILLLLLVGWLDGYFETYLPGMMGGYIQRRSLPFYQRGLAIDLVFENLASLSFALPALILGLITLFLLSEVPKEGHLPAKALSVLLALSTALLLALTGPRLMFMSSQWILGAVLLVLAFVFYQKRREAKARPVLIALLLSTGALFLTSFQWCQHTSPLFAVTTKVLSLFPHGANAPCLGMFGVLSLLIAVSFLLPLSAFSREARRLSRTLSLLLAITLLTYVGILIYFFLDTPLHPFTPIPPLLILAGFTAYSLQTWSGAERRIFLRVLTVFGAVFLAVTAVSLGTDFQNQHYLSATPLYAALLLAALRIIGEQSPEKSIRISLHVFTALTAVIMFSTYPYSALSLTHFQENRAGMQETLAFAEESARRLDAILDACETERYYIVKLGESDFNPFHGYTRHSPLNFFYWAGLEGIDEYHEGIAKREMQNFFSAEIVIAGDGPFADTRKWEEEITTYLQDNFTDVPPPCAEGLPTIPHRTMLYRVTPPSR